MPKIYIHGVAIDCMDIEDAHMAVTRALSEQSSRPCSVFTPNAEIIYRSSRSPHLTDLLNSSDINIADGVGVVWASKRLGTPLPSRLPGIELGEYALSEADRLGLPIFLLGGKPGVAERAADILSVRFPGLEVAGVHHGYFDRRGDEAIAVRQQIERSGAKLIIVCLGFPAQEEWIVSNRDALEGARLLMGLGGSLDVWAGDVSRAPGFARRLGLEWLWRIVREPKRLARATALPAFVLLTIKKAKNVRQVKSEG